MTLSKGEIEHTAELARIKISNVEKQKFSEEFSSILDFVKELEAAPTENVELINQLANLKNITRNDKITESLSVEKVLQNAPAKHDNFIKVKKVFE